LDVDLWNDLKVFEVERVQPSLADERHRGYQAIRNTESRGQTMLRQQLISLRKFDGIRPNDRKLTEEFFELFDFRPIPKKTLFATRVYPSAERLRFSRGRWFTAREPSRAPAVGCKRCSTAMHVRSLNTQLSLHLEIINDVEDRLDAPVLDHIGSHHARATPPGAAGARLQPPRIHPSARSSRSPLVPENQEHAKDHAPENAGQRGYTESRKL
jgi:hypothetical protein